MRLSPAGASFLDTIRDEIVDSLEELLLDLAGMTGGIVIIIVLFVAASFVLRYLRYQFRRSRYVERFSLNIMTLLLNGLTVIVYFLATSMALGILGVDWTALLTAIGISGLVIGLALQDVLKNLVAGVYILLEQPFRIGERIQVREVEGTVETIQIRTTAIRNDADERVLVPNLTVFTEIVRNRSKAGSLWTSVRIEGVTGSLPEFERDLRQTITELPGWSGGGIRVEPDHFGPEGYALRVKIPHSPNVDIGGLLFDRFAERFPNLSISTEST